MEKYRKDILEDMNGHGELEVGNQRYRVAYTFSVLQDQSPEPVSAGDSSQRRGTMSIVGRIKASSRAALIEIASSQVYYACPTDIDSPWLSSKMELLWLHALTAEYSSAGATPARIPAATSQKVVPDRSSGKDGSQWTATFAAMA
jgi:hypothetical protein